MRLLPSDPDIETLVGRIEKRDLDLQPDFQRGEVWSPGKRQRLIDSILRDWHVPPIHVILNEDQTVSVLDGQQRLAAIRDFVVGEIRVDGRLPPYDQRISELDGMRFRDLPYEAQRRFLRFPIRLFTIVDYKPAEPGELFYRLNQLSSLTAAEQRNAFFGSTRQQVKSLVEVVDRLDLGGGLFGFSNARMAYDDVIARSLFLLEAGTLRQKITANALADRYRNDIPFSDDSVSRVQISLEQMAVAQKISAGGISLNKATAQSWITFLATASRAAGWVDCDQYTLPEFMSRFEAARQRMDKDVYQSELRGVRIQGDPTFAQNLFLRRALIEFQDRATSRVADVSSVVLRDFVLWIFLLSAEFSPRLAWGEGRFHALANAIKSGWAADHPIEELADKFAWGAQL